MACILFVSGDASANKALRHQPPAFSVALDSLAFTVRCRAMGCTVQGFKHHQSPHILLLCLTDQPFLHFLRLCLRPIAAACNLLLHFSTPKCSLILPSLTSSLLNAHAHEDDITEAVAALDPALSSSPASPAADIHCLLADSSSPGAQFPPPPIDRAGRRIYYPLDYASVLSAAALRVASGCSVLDVCAAPGGKSIAISQSLKSGGFLVCNEPDGDRRRRLTASLKENCRFRRKFTVECCCYRPLHDAHHQLFPRANTHTFPPSFPVKPSLPACAYVGTMEPNGRCSRSRYRLKGEGTPSRRPCNLCKCSEACRMTWVFQI
jgi:hypothetical protein